MFKRKLSALSYINVENFNVFSDSDFRSLVVWLEDQMIRHYPIEDRSPLRTITNNAWEAAFATYIEALGCPFSVEKRTEVLDWILGLAIRLEYGDNVEKYKHMTAESVKKSTKKTPQVIQKNPLDNIDFETAEFKARVQSLCQVLNVTSHPDHLVTLKALCRVIKTNFSKKALAEKKDKKQGKPFPLNEMILGFETNDPVFANAIKVLRLLYIHDLRSLQTKINETIVAVQGVTANPKTDTRLGKVGR